MPYTWNDSLLVSFCLINISFYILAESMFFLPNLYYLISVTLFYIFPLNLVILSSSVAVAHTSMSFGVFNMTVDGSSAPFCHTVVVFTYTSWSMPTVMCPLPYGTLTPVTYTCPQLGSKRGRPWVNRQSSQQMRHPKPREVSGLCS